MKHILFLTLAFAAFGHALELDFNGWKKFIEEESNGFRNTAYQENQEQGEFQVTYVSHVSEKKSEFTYVQSITVGLKGTENILADVFVTYDKNGQYLKQFLVEKGTWLVSYGRFPGPGINHEEECIMVTERTIGPKEGRRLIFIRKNGLFSLYDPKLTAESKF